MMKSSSLYFRIAGVLLLLLLPLTVAPIAHSSATTNPVVVWNQLTTTLGVAHKVPPSFLSHDYALLQVAIYDALVSDNNKNQPQTAIAAGAANEVLMYLFPSDAATISATFDSQIASVTGSTHGLIDRSIVAGERVGDAVVEYARTDGSTATWNGVMPSGPCIWTGTNPVGPVFGNQKTFVLSSGTEFQLPPPYPCGSAQDLADVKAVIKAHNKLTPDQIALAQYWASAPPPTLWNGFLNDRIASYGLSVFDAARASAYLNVGMYDAFVSCWATKYTYWTARPFQRIPGFVSLIPTPNFPSYTSGHSTVSAAASLIMGHLFPSEASTFVILAQQAAISRLYGGIHFPQDNNNGLTVGFQIGGKVVADMQGPEHTFVYKS